MLAAMACGAFTAVLAPVLPTRAYAARTPPLPVEFHSEMTRLFGWSASKPRMLIDAGAMAKC